MWLWEVISYSWPSFYLSVTWEFCTTPAFFNFYFLNSWSVVSGETLFRYLRCRSCKSRPALVGGGLRVERGNYAQPPRSPSSLPLPCHCPPKAWKLLGYFEGPPGFPGAAFENHWILQLLGSLSNVTFGYSLIPGFRVPLHLHYLSVTILR